MILRTGFCVFTAFFFVYELICLAAAVGVFNELLGVIILIAMINPVITGKSGAFQTEEGCLSLDGVRPCTRYKEIEVDYLDQNFKKKLQNIVKIGFMFY